MWIVPCLNVDGVLAGTRDNANGVDLNRNFASKSWYGQRRAGYHPGAPPLKISQRTIEARRTS